MSKRCRRCKYRVDCLINSGMCLVDREKLEKLQRLVHILPHNNTQRRLLVKRVIIHFEKEFTGSKAQRRGEAKQFILKYASRLSGYYLTANRNAFKASR